MPPSVRIGWIGLGLAATVTTVACVDATHDAQVQALGGEAPGVPPGPNHRPGQPCVLCHGEAGPATPIFSVAGTVYAVQGQKAPAVNATVFIEDVTGVAYSANTNEVGNFYITPDQWSPTFPTKVTVMQGQNVQLMTSHVGRDGSCAACHVDPASTTSPGPVFVALAPASTASSDGGP
jgi:hypothetical protein